MPGALTPDQVADVLDFGSIPSSRHKVKVIGTQAPPGAPARHSSIAEVEHALLTMSSCN